MTTAQGPTGAGRIPGAILVFGWAVFSTGVGIGFLAPSLRVPISLRFGGAGRPWALAGLASFVMAAVFSVVSRLVSISVTTWAAPQYPDPTALAVYEAFDSVHLGSAFMVLAFVAISLFGMATIKTGALEAGRVFVGVGLAGVLLKVAGAAIPAFVYLATAAFGVVTWRLDFDPAGNGTSE